MGFKRFLLEDVYDGITYKRRWTSSSQPDYTIDS